MLFINELNLKLKGVYLPEAPGELAIIDIVAYNYCMPAKLTREELRLVEALTQFAFVNPFRAEREALEGEFVRASGGKPNGTLPEKFGGFFRWIEALPPGKKDYRKFAGEERELMRTVFLVEGYYRDAGALDELIARQLAEGEKSCLAPFGAASLQRMQERGFTREEAARYFGIFYQLRRAHHFIVQGLQGGSASMFEFRRRLWMSVFTDDVRWYERHLWNRMEDFSTLLLGETGAGKGAAAAAIGRSAFIPFDAGRGEFAESFVRGFVPINLAEFPESLIEAELFGHRKGAFTGAVESRPGVLERCSAHGAVFLDEIGEVKPAAQVKLLRVLQERKFSPVGSREEKRFRGRVISATNRAVGELRREKIFRDDFFYRISSDVITVPPLRQRIAEHPAELDVLVGSILARTVGEGGGELAAGVRERLRASPGGDYTWPGNVRELEQAVRRVLLTGRYEPETAGVESEDWNRLFGQAALTADELLAKYAARAVAIHGTRAEAARRLGVDVRTLGSYLRPQGKPAE